MSLRTVLVHGQYAGKVLFAFMRRLRLLRATNDIGYWSSMYVPIFPLPYVVGNVPVKHPHRHLHLFSFFFPLYPDKIRAKMGGWQLDRLTQTFPFLFEQQPTMKSPRRLPERQSRPMHCTGGASPGCKSSIHHFLVIYVYEGSGLYKISSS